MGGPLLWPVVITDLPIDRRPNLICIGAAKAGTTWLAGVLGAHPEIFMPPQKELNALHYNDLEARLDEYAAYFADAGNCKVRCDFSVRYLASPNAPAAAARYAPDATILAVLRNPVDQVQSHYWHLRRQNFHAAEAIVNPPALPSALDIFPTHLLEPALYGKHLARWAELFPRERIVLLKYEDLVGRLNDSLRPLTERLGLAPFDFEAAARLISDGEARRGVQPRQGALGALYPRLYTAATRYPYLWLKQLVGVSAAETLKRRLHLRQLSEAIFFEPGYPKLTPPERAVIHERFRADLVRLAKAYDLDLSAWEPRG